MSAYDEAVTALYQAAFGNFVAERKRLASELKLGGDKAGSAQLLKLARPPVSVWAVNQLWWRERDAFEALVSAAAHVTVGDREASQRHREALARLRERANAILLEGGNGASEQTLRRVTTTLSALAATGFAPDAPGALSADRDPPGFEALGFAGTTRTRDPSSAAEVSTPALAQAATAAAAEAERRRAEAAERERRLAERERLSAALREAQALHERQQHELSRLRGELDTAEQGLKQTQALLAEIAEQLASL